MFILGPVRRHLQRSKIDSPSAKLPDQAWGPCPPNIDLASDEALIETPNRLGYLVVWYYPTYELDGRMTPQIRCFLPGAEG
jgi:hypothetical protein